jgi:hypothetical protein
MTIPNFEDAVESAVIALVAEHLENRLEYFPQPDKQVVKSDDSVLSLGFDYFFLTYPGSFPTESAGTGVIETVWNVSIEIFVRFKKNTKDTWGRFRRFRSDIFNLFNVSQVGRNLNRTAGVKEVLLTGDSEPVPYGEEDAPSDPIFISQTMQLAVTFKINKA